uniref:Uncharacterized protein n=1 Tax=Bactrocera latifrons TaxID=174628 RepID=A0A0K8VU44_BACLA
MSQAAPHAAPSRRGARSESATHSSRPHTPIPICSSWRTSAKRNVVAASAAWTTTSSVYGAEQRCGNVATASAPFRLNIRLGGPGWLNELLRPPLITTKLHPTHTHHTPHIILSSHTTHTTLNASSFPPTLHTTTQRIIIYTTPFTPHTRTPNILPHPASSRF